MSNKISKLKKAAVTLITAAMAVSPAVAASKKKAKESDQVRVTLNVPEKDIIKTGNSREIIGRIVDHKHITDSIRDLSWVEYYVDNDGDGHSDIVCKAIARDGDMYFGNVMPGKMQVYSIVERFNQKYKTYLVSTMGPSRQTKTR